APRWGWRRCERDAAGHPQNGSLVSGGGAMNQAQPHRCVVLVHGVGRQARGATLLAFGEPFAWFVRHYLAADHSVELETDLMQVAQGAGTDSGGASSTIRACIETDPAGLTRHEVIRLREAWWSE